MFLGGFTVCLSTCLMVALSAVFVSVSIGFFLYVFVSLWWLGLLCVFQFVVARFTLCLSVCLLAGSLCL